MTQWTRKCVTHADRVLLVSHADRSPLITAVEEALLEPTSGAELTKRNWCCSTRTVDRPVQDCHVARIAKVISPFARVVGGQPGFQPVGATAFR